MWLICTNLEENHQMFIAILQKSLSARKLSFNPWTMWALPCREIVKYPYYPSITRTGFWRLPSDFLTREAYGLTREMLCHLGRRKVSEVGFDVSRGQKPNWTNVSRGTQKSNHLRISRGTKPNYTNISRVSKSNHLYISRGSKPNHLNISRGSKPNHLNVSRGT